MLTTDGTGIYNQLSTGINNDLLLLQSGYILQIQSKCMFLYRIILTLYREMSIRSKKYVTLVSVQISDQDYNISIYCFSAGNLFVVIVVIVVYHQFSNSSAISWGEQVNYQ